MLYLAEELSYTIQIQWFYLTQQKIVFEKLNIPQHSVPYICKCYSTKCKADFLWEKKKWINQKLWYQAEPFLHRTHKLPCIFAALFVCYSSRSRLRDSLLRPCFDFLLFFTTQTRPVHRETDSGEEKFITPVNKIHNPILTYVWG